MIDEFTQRARAGHEGLIIASGTCDAQTGIGDPYLPFREILALLTGDVESRWSAGAITQEYAQFLWSLIPFTAQAILDAGPDLVDTFITGSPLLARANSFAASGAEWIPRLESLVQRKLADPAVRNPHQNDLFIQYSKVVQLLAGKAPLILVADDLQWADLGSISLLFHLARNLGGQRILILGAYRPEEIALGRGGERHPLAPVINELKREFGEIEINIDKVEGRAFVSALLDSEPNRLGDSFRERLNQLTRGHPLFTNELLRGMQERGDLVKENGLWVEGPRLDWETLPSRVEAVIAERIDRLEPSLQETIRIASVEGELFTAEVVAQVQSSDERELRACLSAELDRKHRLVRAQSIQRLDGRLLSNYRFRHALVQKYLYHSLDEVERVYLHEQVGQVLEAMNREQGTALISPHLARHYLEARNTEKAIFYLKQSWERALQVSAYQDAITHLKRGLELLATLPDSQKYAQDELLLQLSLGIAYGQTAVGFISPEMDQAALRALELCQQTGSTSLHCQVENMISLAWYVKGDHRKARQHALKGLQLGQQVGDPILIALAHWCLGIAGYALGEYALARSYLEQVAEFYQPRQHHDAFIVLRGVDVGLSSLAYLACCLWCLGYPDQAQKRSHEVLALANEFKHSYTLADVLRYGSCEFHKLRRDAVSLKNYAEELLNLTLEKEFIGWLATAKTCLGEALIWLGKFQEGKALVHEGISDQYLMNVHCSILGSLCYLAEGYIRVGELEQGHKVWEEAFDLMEWTGEQHWESELYRVKGKIQLAEGDPVSAEASLLRAIDTARRQAAKSWELRASIDLSRLWRDQGKKLEARQLLKTIYDWFSEGFETPDLKTAKELLEE